jgi:osmotically inducible lipoprotein OsmB
MNKSLWVAVFALSIGAAGCSTYEGMSRAEKGAVIGAGVGALGGAAVSDGSVLGTAAGAAVGGVVGNEVGKRRSSRGWRFPAVAPRRIETAVARPSCPG